MHEDPCSSRGVLSEVRVRPRESSGSESLPYHLSAVRGLRRSGGP